MALEVDHSADRAISNHVEHFVHSGAEVGHRFAPEHGWQFEGAHATVAVDHEPALQPFQVAEAAHDFGEITADVDFAVATERLGVQSSRVDRLPDGDLAEHACQAERDILDAVAVLHPGALLTLWSEDTHPDHAALGRVVDSIGAATGLPVHQFPLGAVHWVDPAGLTTPVGPLALDAQALRSRRAALAAYTSLSCES